MDSCGGVFFCNALIKKKEKKNPRFSDASCMNCIQMDSILLFKLIVSHALLIGGVKL
jgi:hypothetical protein